MPPARHRPSRPFCPILAVALALAMAGCHPGNDVVAGNPRPEQMEVFHPDKLQLSYTLNLEQALSLLKNNRDIMIIDVRAPEEFAVSHLKGAYSYDAKSENFAAEIGELDRGQRILIYGGEDVENTDFAVITMTDLGFRNLYRLSEGIAVWIEAGYPVVQDIPAPDRPPGGPTPETPPAEPAPLLDAVSGERN